MVCGLRRDRNYVKFASDDAENGNVVGFAQIADARSIVPGRCHLERARSWNSASSPNLCQLPGAGRERGLPTWLTEKKRENWAMPHS
jgi:hypothetical protein